MKGTYIFYPNKLVHMAYTNDTTYDDEWYIETDRSFMVTHYYDIGATVRYNTEGHTALEHLVTCQNIVSQKFETIFDLDLFSTYTVYTSKADECKTLIYGNINSVTINNLCTHTPNCLTCNILRSDVKTKMGIGNNKATKTIWTGHALSDGLRSNSIATDFTVVITPWYVIDYNSNANYSVLIRENSYDLMHELSHQLGAHDHYCYGDPNDRNNKCTNSYCDIHVYGRNTVRDCIMGVRMDLNEQNTTELYCADCLNTINAHLSDHH